MRAAIAKGRLAATTCELTTSGPIEGFKANAAQPRDVESSATDRKARAALSSLSQSADALGQDFSKGVQSGPHVQLSNISLWFVAAAAPARWPVGCALCPYGN